MLAEAYAEQGRKERAGDEHRFLRCLVAPASANRKVPLQVGINSWPS